MQTRQPGNTQAIRGQSVSASFTMPGSRLKHDKGPSLAASQLAWFSGIGKNAAAVLDAVLGCRTDIPQAVCPRAASAAAPKEHNLLESRHMVITVFSTMCVLPEDNSFADDCGRRLSARDRAVQRLNHLRSAEERLDVMEALQQEAFMLLGSSPNGREHFHRKNCHNRRARYINGEWKPVSAARGAD